MLTDLGWNLLSDRCNKLRVLLLYKIIQHLVDIDVDDLLPSHPSNYSTCGQSERFLQYQCLFQFIFPKQHKAMKLFTMQKMLHLTDI